MPTKIVGSVKMRESQHKNKACFKMLRARLYENEVQKRDEANQKELNAKTDIGWGHPNKILRFTTISTLKDLRNKLENTNPLNVLDGDIDQVY